MIHDAILLEWNTTTTMLEQIKPFLVCKKRDVNFSDKL